ncbi:hypothetical protein WMY93_021929 [Mugilogobius chulae]|uniref:Uncharacterized protein n=1 Tax=Mugilogobius chulae TaxID=88201 RepID=A0AAW0NN99_9GOBI
MLVSCKVRCTTSIRLHLPKVERIHDHSCVNARIVTGKLHQTAATSEVRLRRPRSPHDFETFPTGAGSGPGVAEVSLSFTKLAVVLLALLATSFTCRSDEPRVKANIFLTLCRSR